MTLRLQLALLAFLCLAYLGGRWWWLDRKVKKMNAGEMPSETDPSATERIDPLMPSHTDAPVSVPAFDPVAFPNVPSPVPTIADRRGVLSATIDCMARIDIDEPVFGDFALSVMPVTRRIGSKTWLIEGLNTETEHWEQIVPNPGKQHQYQAFQAGIQLVNRHGALNDVEFSEFVVKANELAESLGGTAQFPDMLHEVTRARELEHFTLAHDLRLSLNLQAKRAAWSFSYIQQHAQRAGFVAGVIPGRWVLGTHQLGGDVPLISLTIDTQAAMSDDVSSVPIRKLALSLDVPQVARGTTESKRPFDVMSDLAIRLCASMEALILDEHGLSVDAAALDRTSDELEAVYQRLHSAGMPAGSVLAKRLFT